MAYNFSIREMEEKRSPELCLVTLRLVEFAVDHLDKRPQNKILIYVGKTGTDHYDQGIAMRD